MAAAASSTRISDTDASAPAGGSASRVGTRTTPRQTAQRGAAHYHVRTMVCCNTCPCSHARVHAHTLYSSRSFGRTRTKQNNTDCSWIVGTCNPIDSGEFSCGCKLGWTGVTCGDADGDTDGDCEPNPCQNSGTLCRRSFCLQTSYRLLDAIDLCK